MEAENLKGTKAEVMGGVELETAGIEAGGMPGEEFTPFEQFTPGQFTPFITDFSIPTPNALKDVLPEIKPYIVQDPSPEVMFEIQRIEHAENEENEMRAGSVIRTEK